MELQRAGEYRWILPMGSHPGMRVPGCIYADETMIPSILKDGSLKQVANAAGLPGATGMVLAMPDIHYGYGLPIGGILACRLTDGVISPGGVGFDINCGVRLLATQLPASHVIPVIDRLLDGLYQAVPAGVGSSGKLMLTGKEIRQVMMDGAAWAVRSGYGLQMDIDHCESNGAMKDACPEDISDHAVDRGRGQLGTLGSGNHFVEVQEIRKVFDANTAQMWGMQEGCVTVMIHTGSRGLGHQVCTDYLKIMNRVASRYGISLPDRQLACAPCHSPEGRQYFGAMKAAANFAWANRQCISHWVREAFCSVFPGELTERDMPLVYDVAHNIVKVERHVLDGSPVDLMVHRKGATRAFPAGHDDLPRAYRSAGQPVIIPGDMGTASYLLAGTEYAMKHTFGSACHGAGRRLSRKAALQQARHRSILEELRQKGVRVRAAGRQTIAEEMPDAYKNIDEVIHVVTESGIGTLVAEMKPLGVIKG
ncbi:RtcB family protein [bacterium]|nr:RtcB family protein [candidate division CSSED10-310 bacterium]